MTFAESTPAHPSVAEPPDRRQRAVDGDRGIPWPLEERDVRGFPRRRGDERAVTISQGKRPLGARARALLAARAKLNNSTLYERGAKEKSAFGAKRLY